MLMVHQNKHLMYFLNGHTIYMHAYMHDCRLKPVLLMLHVPSYWDAIYYNTSSIYIALRLHYLHTNQVMDTRTRKCQEVS